MDQRLNKLAIVLQCASTGGWRYVQRLVEALREARPELEITAYLGSPLLQTFASDAPRETLQRLGVQVESWPELPPPPPPGKFRPWRARRYRRATIAYQRWLRQLNAFDAVFFAWPFGLECPELSTRLYFIPHDFNYLHFTGSWLMAPDAAAEQQRLHMQWLTRARPIVSSRFIAGELTTNFRDSQPAVVPLSRLSRTERLPDDEAQTIVRSLGISSQYILSPNNVSSHKNLGQVLGAFYYVRQRYPDLQLIVSGHNTAGIAGYLNSPLYLDHSPERSLAQASRSAVAHGGLVDKHVQSVGMRSDRELAALIQCSRLVINASLYEAGNGAGLDAWAIGAPVVMSDIPAFREHLENLGVQAELCHPRCCFDIRDAICRVLDDPERARCMVDASREALQRFSWSRVAEQYLAIFAH